MQALIKAYATLPKDIFGSGTVSLQLLDRNVRHFSVVEAWIKHECVFMVFSSSFVLKKQLHVKIV